MTNRKWVGIILRLWTKEITVSFVGGTEGIYTWGMDTCGTVYTCK